MGLLKYRKELIKQCQTMGHTGTHSPPLGIERNGMCDVMIRSRVVRSYPLGQACLVFKEIEAMKGAQWEKRAKMVEDHNITPPKESHPHDLIHLQGFCLLE